MTDQKFVEVKELSEKSTLSTFHTGPHSLRTAFPQKRYAVWFMPLLLLVLVGCTRIAGPEGWSGAAVSGDTLIIGTREGEILALDRNTGETRWRFELVGEEENRAVYGTPVVSGDTIYVGAYDSMLYAISLDGELLWQEVVDGSIVGGVTVVDDVLFVGSSIEDSNEGTVYAFDATNGDEKWARGVSGSVWSTPAVENGLVYFGSLDHNVYALSLEDGEEIWRFTTDGAVTAAPVVSDGFVYIGSFDSTFYKLDAASGSEAWRFEGANNWYWTHAILDATTVYVSSLDHNVYALDRATGEKRWSIETEGSIVGAPVIVRDMIAVASRDGKIRLARLQDGSELDACNIEEEVRTSLLAVDDVVYFAARDRSIRALRIKSNGNPDEEWVHFTNKDDPIPRGRAPAC